ncbi:MAG: hypothetical protein JHC33_09205 [Ignisphaera sp.]|jgi:hypothetical protein|nr:hypothetical protein [Ignisphaera sp.]
MINKTSEVIFELEEILKANTKINIVTSCIPGTPLVQDTSQVSAHISLTNAIPKIVRNSPELDAYDFNGFFLVTMNVNCEDNRFRIYDVIDDVQRSILNDHAIWGKLVDRDIISIEFDNAEFFPKRSAIIAVEVKYRLTCN